MDIKLSPQEVSVHNHKAKSFSFCFYFLGVGGRGLKIRAWAGFSSTFVRTRVLTPDPTAGRRDSPCRGVKADADAVFSFGLVDANSSKQIPPRRRRRRRFSPENRSNMNLPTASSRSDRSLAYADASQSPSPVLLFSSYRCGNR